MHNLNHSENIIELRNVSFSYTNQELLKDINLAIHRGDYLGIVGGNGSGKTTLLKIILGLLKPDTGSVRLFGQEISEFKDWSKLGYVPQKVTSFDANFPATARDVVLMGRFGKRGLFHTLTDEDKCRADEALRRVGMLGQRHKLVGDLSGGEQQRVFIARALAGDPEIVFLDEPTVGVEKEVRDDFYKLLQKLNGELNLTVVLITHDIESIAHESMHIACIDRTLVFHHSVSQFFNEEHRVIHPHS